MVGLYYSASILAGRASAPHVLPPCRWLGATRGAAERGGLTAGCSWAWWAYGGVQLSRVTEKLNGVTDGARRKLRLTARRGPKKTRRGPKVQRGPDFKFNCGPRSALVFNDLSQHAQTTQGGRINPARWHYTSLGHLSLYGLSHLGRRL